MRATSGKIGSVTTSRRARPKDRRIRLAVPEALLPALKAEVDGITVRSIGDALVALAAEALRGRDAERRKTG